MLAIRNSISNEWLSSLFASAGRNARHISHSQNVRPTEQQDLPEAAKVDVFVSLAAEPEPQIAEFLLNAQPFAGERSARRPRAAPRTVRLPRAAGPLVHCR